MADYAISYANLNAIEQSLNNISNGLNSVGSGIDVISHDVGTVNDNVKVVYDSVGQLANEFHDFVMIQVKANNLSNSNGKLIQIRQQLDKQFGHYDIVRRTTTGILQADDLGIVKKSTITNATEELMISTPGYWLAPCLVALAAWINDQPELAEKALKEAIRRNDEKTSLFWALVCRRAGRKPAALKWTQRYLANQNEENLDRKAIIILDAFASGLLGSDSEGVVSKQMGEWLERLSEKPGFVEQQTKQWSEAINLKRKPYNGGGYTYLPKYSKTWPLLADVMEGAKLHAEIFNYFSGIFEKQSSTESLKEQLDDILTTLVTEFDDEELPLRKEERFHQYVIQYEGDVERAKQSMAVEDSAFEVHKDFTQLLTDAAMKPESSHSSPSTQKFAIALSKEWISNAYNDVVGQNRMKVPHEIEINVDTYNGVTTDGENEEELLNEFNIIVSQEEQYALSQNCLSGFEQFCLWGGIAIGVVGLIMLFTLTFLGVISIIAAVGLIINHFSKKKKVEANRVAVKEKFQQKREAGTQIIRATLAEVVDFRREFARNDAESQKVVDFLEQITPDQYVKKLSHANRKIKVTD